MRWLSECCDAREWLDDPQGQPPCGICSKCNEHSEFYDADKADEERHQEWKGESERERSFTPEQKKIIARSIAESEEDDAG